MVIINDNCIGCGICTLVYPECFEINIDTNTVEIICEDPNLDLIQEVIDQCPMNAIKV